MMLTLIVLIFSSGWAAARAQTPDILFSQGLQAYAAEEYDRAMSLFEKAVQAAPGVAQYHHWYGRAAGRRAERVMFLRAMGLAGKVRESFEKAALLDGSDTEILSDLLEFYLEAPGIVGGGQDKARVVAERLAKLSAAEGHRAQARLLTKNKDLAGAERELRRALELEPDKVGRVLELASLLSRQGRYEEADALFERAAQMAPESPNYLFSRGAQLARTGRNPDQARQLLEAYLKSRRQPDDPPPSEVRELLKKL